GGPYTVGRTGQPAQRPPTEDAHPTVPTPSRRWRRRWFLGGAGLLALAASASAGAWLAGGASPVVTPTPVSTGVSVAGAGGEVPPGCRPGLSEVDLPAGVRCVSELECYGPVRVRRDRAEAARVPCDGRHTWEAYAEGELPEALTGAGHAAISADPVVRSVCNVRTFRLTSGLRYQAGWKLEVLPPAETDVDRTYRCLAGRGVDALAAPTLTGR
ncbi:MAG: serine/threonine protein kinase, partial [Micromonospora sp.]